MGVTKEQISPGDGTTKAKKGDTITMEYTGNLFDSNAPNKKGKQFDSSVGRGDFKTSIGTGQVIKGWYLAFLYSEYYRHTERADLESRRKRRWTGATANTSVGWDEGVLNVDGGMTLGEKATLTITGYASCDMAIRITSVVLMFSPSDYAYGAQGFPGLIPPNSTLVFDVQLKAIGDKKM
ncbi:hypothetical protein LTR09_005678 [Extremus antarcticus]|uniref:peptidylprolyl isomerase n=1 Tax=Extremus antarcticus TaxID=702011 RepID=A0AAJ0DMF8_9PEZI|nr:hypothetical protein LTR09_005678 [Extremus antarcticus]